MDQKGIEYYRPTEKAFAWFKVLLAGAAFYFISLVILIITGNPNLFPTVVLIGNFLVPVTYVAFFYERRHYSSLSMPTTAFTFLYGGLVGVLASSILEPIFVRPMNPTSVLTVGLIEEAAKILGVLIIARRIQQRTEMDGLILGAAAGMGFAALESMGYAFTSFLSSGGSLTAVVYVTMLRGILSPVGHGTWTAILAGVLFRESQQGHFRINGKVIFAFLGVALLHALWDGLPPLVAFVFSPGIDVFIAQTIVGGIGLLVLWLRWREARRLQMAQLLQPDPLIVEEKVP
jgi:protease PrsW